MSRYELLLAPHDGQLRVPITLDPAVAGGFPVPWESAMAQWHADIYGDLRGDLLHRSADRNDLRKQGWRVLVLDNERGRGNLAALSELLERRAAQQGCEVKSLVQHFPGPLADDQVSFERAFQWVRQEVDNPAFRDKDVPLYRLIIGDLDEIPVTVQQALALGGATGRLAFDDPGDYRAYAKKVLTWERGPSYHSKAGVVFYTADSGDSAIERGHAGLMQHSHSLVDRDHQCDELNSTEPRLQRSTVDSPDKFLEAVETKRPGVLVTLSHGEGPPEDGWGSSDAQRHYQGALRLGQKGRLHADHLGKKRSFLPGGIWFMHACFGAGTPAKSQYADILSEDSIRLMVHDSHLHTDGSPFVASLPKAALRNRHGPMAFIGHVDLAWTYSFTQSSTPASSLDSRNKSPYAWLADIVKYLVEPNRVGVAVTMLASHLQRSHTELLGFDRQLRHARGAAARSLVYRRTRTWMQRVDLASYILLGDPAVRLPLKQR